MTPSPPMTESARRDAYKFLTFVVLCSTIVLCVWIGKGGSWNQERWAALAAIGAVGQFLVVGVAAVVAYGQLSEIKRTRQEQTRPYVIVYLVAEPSGHLVHLVLENIGTTPAHDVVVNFDPPLVSTFDWWRPPVFLERPIGFLAPGQSIKTILDSSLERGKAVKAGRELRGEFVADLRYRDSAGTPYHEKGLALAVDIGDGTFFATRKSVHNVAVTLEKIERVLDRVASGYSELRVATETVEEKDTREQAQMEEHEKDLEEMRRQMSQTQAPEGEGDDDEGGSRPST